MRVLSVKECVPRIHGASNGGLAAVSTKDLAPRTYRACNGFLSSLPDGATSSLSGFSVTAPMGRQWRVLLEQRSGLLT